jgi:hypothetical protein
MIEQPWQVPSARVKIVQVPSARVKIVQVDGAIPIEIFLRDDHLCAETFAAAMQRRNAGMNDDCHFLHEFSTSRRRFA